MFSAGKLLCFALCLIARADTPAISNDPLLLIIHPYKSWDQSESAKLRLNQVVSVAKKKGVATAYVLDSTDPIYLEDKKPTHSLMASTGQFPNPVQGKEIFLGGGNWGFCLSNALGSTLANEGRDGVKINVITDATFIFLEEKNLAQSLAALDEETRTKILMSEFQAITDRWLKDKYCLQVFYENVEVGKTKNHCPRTAKIYLAKGLPGPLVPTGTSVERKSRVPQHD